MEILIYISGLLTTFIAVLLVAAIKINRKYNLLLDTQFLRTPRYMDTNARGYIYIIRRTAGGIYI
jgi:hypothetical protein